MATPNIVPRSDSEGGLGTASKYWGSAYIDTITTTSHINLPDNAILKLGTGADLQILHTGTSSQINNATGKLQINSFDDDIEIVQYGNDKDIIFKSDDGTGGVETYFFLDGSISSGSPVTIFPDNSQLMFGDDLDLRIYHDSNNSYIDDAGTGILNIRGDNQILFGAPAGGEVYAIFNKDGACQFRHNDGTRLATTATGISVTGATGTAEGGGIDATDAVSIKVGEVNGEIITTIFVDIGIGSIQSSSTNTGAIGNGTDAAAYITRVTTAINGIVYKAELICVEVPTVASGALSADIDLTANSSSIASGSAVSGSPICNSAGDHTLGRFVRSTDSTTNTITPNDYLYLAQGNTNAGVYNAGKFLIRLYGAKTTGL